jgi:hypothetical protein
MDEIKVERCELCKKVTTGELVSVIDLMESGDREALMLFWTRTHQHPVKTARKLFPTKPRGYVTATVDLSHYASNKAVAINERLKGNIQAAEIYEKICENIYNRLPTFARW